MQACMHRFLEHHKCSPVPMLVQYQVLRQKGTEAPGTGEFNKHTAEGTYTCAGCGTALYAYAPSYHWACHGTISYIVHRKVHR